MLAPLPVAVTPEGVFREAGEPLVAVSVLERPLWAVFALAFLKHRRFTAEQLSDTALRLRLACTGINGAVGLQEIAPQTRNGQ